MTKYIKKVSLKSVENYLGVNLTCDTISIGADTACYYTSFAVIKTTNSYLILESLEKITVPKLAKKVTIKQVLNNVDLFTEQLDYLKNKWSKKYKFDQTRIEDCFYQFSIKTTKLLAYNGILTYDRLKRISKNTTLTMPNSARKNINFKASQKKLPRIKLKKEIIKYINLALNLKIENDNESDAIVLALSGLIKNEI